MDEAMMMLVDQFMVPCRKVTVTSTPDGEGGFSQSFADGAEFEAAIIPKASSIIIAADGERPADSYSVTVPKGTGLALFAIFKRVSDGAMFKVVCEAVQSPDCASFGFEHLTAERFTA